uniref:Uncharacterized protein n=1 Tax=Candidatus Kentrum sp. SD TaxID=2126332 RepID=A0A451BKG8_9GAMM|nr:MAG: hypothetical protein BECKSD772D_GA0070982_10262 [Candidatus Kentron sp. SD]
MGNKEHRYLTHTGMKDYFCSNAKDAREYHENLARTYEVKLDAYDKEFGNAKTKFGITGDEAAQEKRVNGELPDSCPKN